jgi:hypothetical protein
MWCVPFFWGEFWGEVRRGWVVVVLGEVGCVGWFGGVVVCGAEVLRCCGVVDCGLRSSM